MDKHNHYAIAVAVLLQQLLGVVWYSPNFFGPLWARGVGKALHQFYDFGSGPYIAALFAAILFSYLMSWLFMVLVVDDWRRGLSVGLLIGCGFIAPMMITHYMMIGLPYTVIMVDSLKEVVAAGMTGIILSTWRAEPSKEVTT